MQRYVFVRLYSKCLKPNAILHKGKKKVLIIETEYPVDFRCEITVEQQEDEYNEAMICWLTMKIHESMNSNASRQLGSTDGARIRK